MTGSADQSLRFGPLGATAVHLCVDMQRMFAEATDWHTPWLERVLPNVVRLAEHRPSHCVFTRFVPIEHTGDGFGTWKRYYKRWASMTVDRLGREMVQLVPDLAKFVPPAKILDKMVYSPWTGTALDARLRQGSMDTLIVSGGETDVCVLSTVLGAIDLGYRVVVVTDALCSSSDQSHEAMLALYRNRFSQQVETASTEEVLGAWK